MVEGAIRWYANPETALLPTTQVEGDTRAWRKDADRILGFWDEWLWSSDDHCILKTEMFEEFNRWLKSNGHIEWSKELFGPRFAQHNETTRHRVTEARPRPEQLKTKTVSTRALASIPLPSRPIVYSGVRFQTAADKEKRESGQGGQGPSETFSYTREAESFPKGLSTLSTPDHSDPNGAATGPPNEPSDDPRDVLREVMKRCPDCGHGLVSLAHRFICNERQSA